MGLYPDLLPTDYRKQLQYPNPLPGLSGAELEKAHLALIDYLTQVSAPMSVFRAGLFSFSILCCLTLMCRKQYAYSGSVMLALMGCLHGWKLAAAPEKGELEDMRCPTDTWETSRDFYEDWTKFTYELDLNMSPVFYF